MATQLELERINTENTLKAYLIEQVRVGVEATAGLNDKQKRERFQQGVDALNLNYVMSLRTMWLEHMRKLKEQQTKQAITLAEEMAHIAFVDAKLRVDPAWLNNYKYESDEIPKVKSTSSNTTGWGGAFNEMLSKMTGAFGDGPFAFIGKLLAQIFSFIFPMISTLKDMGKKTTEDLIKEGSLDEADTELTIKENELISKLGVFEETQKKIDAGDAPEVKGLKDAIGALEVYKQQLLELKAIDVEGGGSVLFSEGTEAYKRSILTSRLKIFNEVSAAVVPGLAAHEELVSVTQQHALQHARYNQLNGVVIGKVKAEAEILQARMAAIKAEEDALAEKMKVVEAQEKNFLANMAGAKAHVEALFNKTQPLFQAEAQRQKERLEKIKQDAKKAAEYAEAETQHRRAVEQEKAKHPAVMPHA